MSLRVFDSATTISIDYNPVHDGIIDHFNLTVLVV
jgi:hypothetical protein